MTLFFIFSYRVEYRIVFYNWGLFLFSGCVQLDELVDNLIFSVGVYVCVEDCQTVNVSDRARDFSQTVNVLFVHNTLLKDCFSLTFQSPEEKKHEFFQVLDLQFRLFAQLTYIVLYYVLSLHIHLVELIVFKKISKSRFFLLNVKLIFPRILSWRNKNDGLVEPIQSLDPLLALHDPLPNTFDSGTLLLTLLHVSLRNRGGCLAQSMKIDENLVTGFTGVQIVDRQIEIIWSYRALGTLVHSS